MSSGANVVPPSTPPVPPDEPTGPRQRDGSIVSGHVLAGVWWRGAAFLAIGLVLAFGLLGALWLLATPLQALVVLAFAFVVQQLKGHLLMPYVTCQQAGLAQSKHIVVDMFAKAVQGDTPEATVRWAANELSKIYTG